MVWRKLTREQDKWFLAFDEVPIHGDTELSAVLVSALINVYNQTGQVVQACELERVVIGSEWSRQIRKNIAEILLTAQNLSRFVVADCLQPHLKVFDDCDDKGTEDFTVTVKGEKFYLVPEIAHVLANSARYLAVGKDIKFLVNFIVRIKVRPLVILYLI
jgi:hypothetical protein